MWLAAIVRRAIGPDVDRRTMLEGLFAVGDVAGGTPYKFVSGCWAEGIIAARCAAKFAEGHEHGEIERAQIEEEKRRVYAPLIRFQRVGEGVLPKEAEERLQKVMDEYAGGISVFYEMNEERLLIAKRELQKLREQIEYFIARDMHELMLVHEVIDRIDVAQVLLEHLLFRKETRWPGYQTRLDYPDRDDSNWLCFVNSKRDRKTGAIEVFKVPYEQIVPGDRYRA